MFEDTKWAIRSRKS